MNIAMIEKIVMMVMVTMMMVERMRWNSHTPRLSM